MIEIICKSPIQQIDDNLWIKREDLIPFSFGGNKARKSILFFKDFDKGNYDCVVTYGSSSSNHCRIIANICSSRQIPCYIIMPEEQSKETNNSKFLDLFGAIKTIVPVFKVHDTIEKTINRLRLQGNKPYFIPGGGHGNIGTEAYVNCYNEILQQEQQKHIHFDYIFFASGTGTTQAGLVCGQILHNDKKSIIGISIARSAERGRQIILESIKDYLGYLPNDIDSKVVFVDEFVKEGYGSNNKEIKDTIDYAFKKYGIPLDHTYTGKAFYGMKEYIKKHNIEKQNVLFIHTGGTPLFFDEY